MSDGAAKSAAARAAANGVHSSGDSAGESAATTATAADTPAKLRKLEELKKEEEDGVGKKVDVDAAKDISMEVAAAGGDSTKKAE